jgi:hypothetical protein
MDIRDLMTLCGDLDKALHADKKAELEERKVLASTNIEPVTSSDDKIKILEERLRAANERISVLVSKNSDLKTKLVTEEQKTKHWQTLRKAIQENPMLKEQWDEFCILLRLSTD